MLKSGATADEILADERIVMEAGGGILKTTDLEQDFRRIETMEVVGKGGLEK